MDGKTLGVIGLAFVAFAAIVGIRWSFGEKYQVTLTDLLVLAAPIMLWLVVTNKLGELTLGTDGLTIKAAANQPVQSQLSQISVQEIKIANKGSIEDIPKLIEQKIQGLKLQVNRNDYYDEYVLEKYLSQLTKFSFFQFVVINDDHGRFAGAIDARNLNASLASGVPFSYAHCVAILNDHRSADDLAQLPGFVSKRQAIQEAAGKGEALSRTDRANLSGLCVLRDDQFLGIIDRSHVASSIILDVAKQLGAAGSE